MKIGLVVESGLDGADVEVCRRLINCVYEEAGTPPPIVSASTHRHKGQLVQHCGIGTRILLGQGCERVFIVWDLRPSTPDSREPLCRRHDRELIERSLRAAAVDRARVELVCIEKELESWLIADARALKKLLDKPHRKAEVDDEKRPDRIDNPKAKMMGLFAKHGQLYRDARHAPLLIEALPDLKRIRRSESFKRFALKLIT